MKRFVGGYGAVGWTTLWVLCACGEKPQAAPEAQASSGEERGPEESPDTLSVTGLRGTLSQEEVQNALEPRMLKFARCVQQRSEAVEWLAGSMTFEFHVGLDGKVMRAYPRASSIGDRTTERCATEVALATRFPAPHGGEADFSWSFEVPLDSAIREPVALTQADVAAPLEAQRSLVESACGSGSFSVTAYVDTEGKVVAAGAAAGDEDSAQKLDCVAGAVSGFAFDSPGSYVAKVQFNLP